MIGKLISTTLKVVTSPIDATNAATDVILGGDGSKQSRNHPDKFNPLSTAEQVKDALILAIEEAIDN